MKFITGEAALQINDNIVISDLHIGIEKELAQKGVNIPLQWTIQKINNLLKPNQNLIIGGDAKHIIYSPTTYAPTPNQLNIQTLSQLLNKIKCEKIIIVKGNHDTQIEKIQSARISVTKEIILKERSKTFSIIHGHMWPSEEALQTDYLIISHEHPGIQFKGDYNYTWREKAWIIGRVKKNAERHSAGKQVLIIMPSFSDFTGMNAFNQAKERIEANHKVSNLSPVIKHLVNVNECEAVLLNGLNLGKIKNLKQ
jgi:putative SbcD/Mre11-related phosphoesterase